MTHLLSPRTKLRVGLCTLDDNGDIVSIWNFGDLEDVLNDLDSNEGRTSEAIEGVAEHVPGEAARSSRPLEFQAECDGSISADPFCGILDCGHRLFEGLETQGEQSTIPVKVFTHLPMIPRLEGMFNDPLLGSIIMHSTDGEGDRFSLKEGAFCDAIFTALTSLADRDGSSHDLQSYLPKLESDMPELEYGINHLGNLGELAADV